MWKNNLKRLIGLICIYNNNHSVNIRKYVQIGRYLADFHRKVARPTANAPTQMYLNMFLMILKMGCVMIIIIQFSEVKHCGKVRRLVCTYTGIGRFWREKHSLSVEKWGGRKKCTPTTKIDFYHDDLNAHTKDITNNM